MEEILNAQKGLSDLIEETKQKYIGYAQKKNVVPCTEVIIDFGTIQNVLYLLQKRISKLPGEQNER